jgi:hypothetical protein
MSRTVERSGNARTRRFVDFSAAGAAQLKR